MLGEGVARRGGLQRVSEAKPMRKYQRRFSGPRSDRRPNESMSSQCKGGQLTRGRMVESMVVRSDRTPQPALVWKIQ